MDYLLQTMKFIVQLDEQLTEYRKNKPNDIVEIQRLEKDFIQQLIDISTQLADSQIQRQVHDLTNRFSTTELLIKLRPIVLSGKGDYLHADDVSTKRLSRDKNACENYPEQM